MTLADDINALPTTVGDGNTGHHNNHQVIHAALKDHESRIGARDIIGTGSPLNRITAPIGSTYTDTDVTSGALRWIKTDDNGRDGWKVLYGDTGWVDIKDSMVNGWTAETMMIRRQDNITRLRYTNLDATAATSSYFVKMVYGYGGNDATHYQAAAPNKTLSFWANNWSLSLPVGENVKTSIMVEVVIPVDVDRWPTDLGGTKL